MISGSVFARFSLFSSFFETSNWSCVRTITTDHRMWVNFIPFRCNIIILFNNSACANISPDSRLLAISDLVHGFTMYNCQSGGLIRRFIHEVGKRYPVPVLFIHQGRVIVGGRTVGHVNIWDIEDGRRIEALDIPGACYEGFLPILVSTFMPSRGGGHTRHSCPSIPRIEPYVYCYCGHFHRRFFISLYCMVIE